MTETKFAYWVPNVSGGLVTSTIEQRTDWGYEYNRDLARIAEDAGFEYALSQVRYTASYGAEYQHESTSFSLALLDRARHEPAADVGDPIGELRLGGHAHVPFRTRRGCRSGPCPLTAIPRAPRPAGRGVVAPA